MHRFRGSIVKRPLFIWFLLLSFYIVPFLLYHTLTPVRELHWQRSARYHVGDSCTLLLEYPYEVPLESPDQAGRRIVARLWISDSSAMMPCVQTIASTEKITYSVEFAPLGDGLIFTDVDGEPRPASLSLYAAVTEGSAVPAKIYVRRAPAASQSSIVMTVHVWAYVGTDSPIPVPTELQPRDAPLPQVQPESTLCSDFRHFTELIFTVGPIQGLVAILTALFALWNLYTQLQDRQLEVRDRRSKQRDRIAAVGALPLEQAWTRYRALSKEFEEPGLRNELLDVFRREFLPQMRQATGKLLRPQGYSDAHKNLRQMAEEWHRFGEEGSYAAISSLIALLEQSHLTSPQSSGRLLRSARRRLGLLFPRGPDFFPACIEAGWRMYRQLQARPAEPQSQPAVSTTITEATPSPTENCPPQPAAMLPPQGAVPPPAESRLPQPAEAPRPQEESPSPAENPPPQSVEAQPLREGTPPAECSQVRGHLEDAQRVSGLLRALEENLAQAQAGGDSQELRQERYKKLGKLDEIAQAVLSTSLSKICWTPTFPGSKWLGGLLRFGRASRLARPLSLRRKLQNVLNGFCAVGLTAAEPIVAWLEEQYQEALYGPPELVPSGRADLQRALEEVLFAGRAGGKFLLRQWASDGNGWIKENLDKWERSSPRGRQSWYVGPNILWPRERPQVPSLKKGLHLMGLSRNPFGPTKAEMDPELPHFFYRNPIWEEVVSPQSNLFVAPPGCGRTSLIWMARYECGRIGSPVEHAFPVLITVDHPLRPPEFGALLVRRLAESLCAALAEDPYELLALPEREQRGIIEVLDALGEFPALTRRLEAAGLDLGEAEGRLLIEQIMRLSAPGKEAAPGASSPTEAALNVSKAEAAEDAVWANLTLGNVSRLYPHGAKYILLFVDVTESDAPKKTAADNAPWLQPLVEQIFHGWLSIFGTHHVHPKIFVPKKMPTPPIVPYPIEWSPAELRALLTHRWKQAGVSHDFSGLFEGAQKYSPEARLVQAAEHNPGRLIALGNRIIERYGEKGRVTYADLTRICSTEHAHGQ